MQRVFRRSASILTVHCTFWGLLVWLLLIGGAAQAQQAEWPFLGTSVPVAPCDVSGAPPCKPLSVSKIIAPRNYPAIVYAAVRGDLGYFSYDRSAAGGVFKSSDGGASWHDTGLTGNGVSTIAVDPNDPGVLFAAVLPPQYSAVEGGGIYRTTDGGQSWRRVGEPRDTQIEALAIDPLDASILYAGGQDGLYRSTDTGSTWVRIHDASTQIVATAMGLFAATPLGLDTSTDGGSSWRRVFGSDDTPRTVKSIAIDPAHCKVLYLGAADSTGIAHAVFKSTDGGETWSEKGTFGTYYDELASSIAIDAADPETVYFGYEGIHRSTDGGTTWQSLDALPDGGSRIGPALAVLPGAPRTLFAAGYFGEVAAVTPITPPACAGDCSGDGKITIDDLVTLVRILLGDAELSACAVGNRNGDTEITVDEIIAAQRLAENGCQGGADMVLFNGKVFTGLATQPEAEAIAIRSGRILAIGTSEDVLSRATPETERIDLGGRTVVPGLNDAHVHVYPTAPLLLFDVGLDPTLNAAVDALAGLAASAPADSWIGGTIGPTILDDPAATRTLLDQVAPQHRVRLRAFTNHGLLINTSAMSFLGIAPNEPDPLGGFFVRFPGSDIITGLAHEYAQARLDRRIVASQPERYYAREYATVSQVAAQFGATSIQLMGTAQPSVDAAHYLGATNPTVRWRLIGVPHPDDPAWPAESLQGLESADQHVTVSGLKWFLDGTGVERLAALREPYSDRPMQSGQVNFEPAVIQTMLTTALETGEQPMFHAVGDRSIDVLLDALERVAPPATWSVVRPRIEHGDGLRADQIARARRLGVIVVQNPGHLLTPELIVDRLGERAQDMSYYRTLVEAGIPFALGSDGPWTPWQDIMWAVDNPSRPGESLTREQAVSAHTAGSAYAESTEAEKGRLLPGFLADIAVLSDDVFTIPVQQIGNVRSVLTLVGGKIVHRAM